LLVESVKAAGGARPIQKTHTNHPPPIIAPMPAQRCPCTIPLSAINTPHHTNPNTMAESVKKGDFSDTTNNTPNPIPSTLGMHPYHHPFAGKLDSVNNANVPTMVTADQNHSASVCKGIL